MRTLTCLLITLAFCKSISAQFKQHTCDLTPDWKNIKLVHEPLPDSLPKILVVTNRPFYPDHQDKIYLPNSIAQYRRITYLEVACDGAIWMIRPMESFNEGMKILENEKDILLFVHGHGKTFPFSLPRAFRMKEIYGVSLILFDWPAKNSNFNKSLARVRRCGENFYNLLVNLKEYKEKSMSKDQHLSILAHSLGNYFLTHFVVNGSWQYQNEPFIDNIIFNAPAVRSKEHGEVISLITFSRRKYVILNKNDRILRGAHLLTSGKMLGNYVIKPHANNTEYIHFTEIAGKEHTYFAGYHRFESENENVFKLYNDIIHGLKPQLNPPGFKLLNEKEYMIK